MRKITLEISAPVLQATMVCLATFFLVGALTLTYVGGPSVNQVAGQTAHESPITLHQNFVESSTESARIEQPPPRPQPMAERNLPSVRSREPGTNPKKLVGSLATNLVNLVGQFSQKLYNADRQTPGRSTSRSKLTEEQP